MESIEDLTYVVTFADNGVVITPEAMACSVYEEDSDGFNSKACKAIGEEIYSILHEEMLNSPYYRFKVTVSFEPLKD